MPHIPRTWGKAPVYLNELRVFEAKWLLPQIDKFQELHTDITFRLDISRSSIDFTEYQIDIGVRYGLGSGEGLESEKLLDEEVYPVCAPALLHDSLMEGHSAFTSWKAWLQKAVFSDVTVPRGMKINNSAACVSGRD